MVGSWVFCKKFFLCAQDSEFEPDLGRRKFSAENSTEKFRQKIFCRKNSAENLRPKNFGRKYSAEKLLTYFGRKFSATLSFSAENWCWPKLMLTSQQFNCMHLKCVCVFVLYSIITIITRIFFNHPHTFISLEINAWRYAWR